MNEQEKLIYQISVFLKEGDSFKKMWKEFKKCCRLSIQFDDSLQAVVNKMDFFEQRYSPKTKGV